MRLKVVYKGNGKDVLWSLSTLRFTTSENPFRIASFLSHIRLLVQVIILKLERRLDTKTLIHLGIRLESSAESVQMK